MGVRLDHIPFQATDALVTRVQAFLNAMPNRVDPVLVPLFGLTLSDFELCDEEARRDLNSWPAQSASCPLSPLVGVARRGIAGVGAVRFGAELHADQVGAAELVQAVVDAPADAGAVDEHPVGIVRVDLLHDYASDKE